MDSFVPVLRFSWPDGILQVMNYVEAWPLCKVGFCTDLPKSVTEVLAVKVNVHVHKGMWQ